MANTIVINETPRYSLSVTGSEELQLSVAGGNELQVSLNGPAGPVGPTGATGAAGPNTITTSTSSNLTGFIAANGTAVSGATAGASAATANTLVLRDATGGSNFAAVGASSVTSSGGISTTGESAAITTSGAHAGIYTTGATSDIFTFGETANIFTSGTNAHIQSRSTFKLYNGTNYTTLSHSPTADRAIAFPNKAGTVAMVDAETHTGAHAFSSTTRPTSEGTGTPEAKSLITRADGDTRFGSIGLAATSAITITSSITPQTIRSATLAVGVYHVRMVFQLTGTANTGTRHGYDFSGTATVRFFRSRAPSPTYIQVTSTPSFDLGLTESSTSAVIEGIINVTVAGTFSMQVAQNTSHVDALNVGASNHMIITPCPNGSIS